MRELLAEKEQPNGIGRRRLVAGALALGGTSLVAMPSSAQTPSGTVDITQVQIAFIGSANLGSGRLYFQGRTYPFSIGGLGAGGFGVSRIEAAGSVFNLQSVSQFPGLYLSERYGVAAGDLGSGGGELFLQNSQGIKMRLRAQRQGLALSLGADGIQISLK